MDEPVDELSLIPFAENPDPRCPLILLLDTSGSMQGNPIHELNQGLKVLKNELVEDDLAARRVELLVITFGFDGVVIHGDWAEVRYWEPPELRAGGSTPLGQATHIAMDKLQERKKLFRAVGIEYYRPWVFLISDGAPTDEWESAARRARAMEDENALAFFSIGVTGADFATLQAFSRRQPQRLAGLRFKELFRWLSASLKGVSRSRVGHQVELPPLDWSAV